MNLGINGNYLLAYNFGRVKIEEKNHQFVSNLFVFVINVDIKWLKQRNK